MILELDLTIQFHHFPHTAYWSPAAIHVSFMPHNSIAYNIKRYTFVTIIFTEYHLFLCVTSILLNSFKTRLVKPTLTFLITKVQNCLILLSLHASYLPLYPCPYFLINQNTPMVAYINIPQLTVAVE